MVVLPALLRVVSRLLRSIGLQVVQRPPRLRLVRGPPLHHCSWVWRATRLFLFGKRKIRGA